MITPVLLTVDDDRDVLSAIARDLRKHYSPSVSGSAAQMHSGVILNRKRGGRFLVVQRHVETSRPPRRKPRGMN